MVDRDGRRRAGLLLMAASACATGAYSPCPVEVPGGLPPGAFRACRLVLADRYGPLAVADEASFLLQTEWVPVLATTAERRATVFRDGCGGLPEGLAVVVETRRLTEPLVGMPAWTPSRGDPAAERELADWLTEALSH